MTAEAKTDNQQEAIRLPDLSFDELTRMANDLAVEGNHRAAAEVLQVAMTAHPGRVLNRRQKSAGSLNT